LPSATLLLPKECGGLVTPTKRHGEDFHVTMDYGDRKERLPMATYTGIQLSGHFTALFESVYEGMQGLLPAQTKLVIGQKPLVCITPLLGDEDGNMRPLTANVGRF
jgi:hypothetical protein